MQDRLVDGNRPRAVADWTTLVFLNTTRPSRKSPDPSTITYRCRSASRIASLVFPDAKMRNTCPNLASYRPFITANARAVSSVADAAAAACSRAERTPLC